MSRKLVLVLGLATVAVLSSACGDDDVVPGTDAGGGGGTDSGSSAVVGCPMAFAACTSPVDMSGMSAISIMTGPGFVYTPNCIRVSPGTAVTIDGSSTHPLNKAACSPAGGFDGVAMMMSPQTATLTAPGRYGFHCSNHGGPMGTGMSAIILVE